MAASPEVFLAAPEPFSPSIFLNLPVTPRPDSNGDGKDPLASSDDLLVLPLIERMLMEDEGMNDDDSFLYQFPDDDPVLLRAQEPYVQILSDSSSSVASTTTLPESSGDKGSALLNDADDEEMKKQSNAMFGAGHAALASAFFSDQDGGTRAMLRVAFLKGMQEANKILPRGIQHVPATVQVKEEDGNGNDSNGRGRKTNRHNVDFNWGDALVLEAETGRKSKLMAPEPEESGEVVDEMVANGYELFLREVESLRISMEDSELSADQKKKKNRQRKGQSSPSNGTVVDLCTLLIHCAQAVAANDRRSATQLLTQIKRHSSPSGDATQRLGHCFAQGLEARLAGPGSQVYESSLMAKQHTSAVDFLKAYRFFTAACCFRMMAFKFANLTICKAIDDSGRRKVHIVDYGIHYGSQWPGLLKFFSAWPGGPPEVRITGIDLPQLGFRPAARVEETGRRLTSYASRFGVPFRFHGIAAKWETVTVHDLDIDPDEVLIVNSILHFGNLMDEGVDPSSPSPRDVVLTNICEMRPDVFILFTGNGSYSTPYFVPRFREALLHYSTMFDMMDATTPRDSDLRLLVERDLFGRCAQNAIACEGLDRVERPETYKQWQRRNHRAGLRQVPLDPCIVKSVRENIRDMYHENFITDVDSQWLLGGWKGRILYAVSTWAADR